MDNWKPKEGDWVITRSQNGVDDYTESLCIYHEGHGQSVLRKATLDDFAFEIPNFGKVWFVEYNKDHSYSIYADHFPKFVILDEYNKKIEGWDKLSIDVSEFLFHNTVKSNNITVMSETLWKELRK